MGHPCMVYCAAAANSLLAFTPICLGCFCCVCVFYIFWVLATVYTGTVVHWIVIITQPAIYCCYTTLYSPFPIQYVSPTGTGSPGWI
ncbi:Uncharacterised protein [Chlamydia trachomatis]|nr:Uncharacterised protein [Chlamydia trachomatis]